MEVFENLKANLVGKNARIVLPEGEEPRILQAAKRIVNETDVTPVLLGNPDKIRIYLEIEGVLEGYEVIDPHSYPGFEEMVASLVDRRKGKMTLSLFLLTVQFLSPCDGFLPFYGTFPIRDFYLMLPLFRLSKQLFILFYSISL